MKTNSATRQFFFGGINSDSFNIQSFSIRYVHHFNKVIPTRVLSLFGSKFVFSGDCTISNNTIFNVILSIEPNFPPNSWRAVSAEEKDDSDSSKTLHKLRETLINKYGAPQYVEQKEESWHTLSVYAWQKQGLIIILSFDAKFDKGKGNLYSDRSEISLQYIREDLLPKAKAESDAYEAVKKAEAERKAKADAEAWPEEMKKAMESL